MVYQFESIASGFNIWQGHKPVKFISITQKPIVMARATITTSAYLNSNFDFKLGRLISYSKNINSQGSSPTGFLYGNRSVN
ncbi:MAG: hypothetical protein P0116_13720 [Candidatus Nitrosocosmicus sp.]|nr:hypothetical protein [Candidatus Nitrosocosmicus sp.]